MESEKKDESIDRREAMAMMFALGGLMAVTKPVSGGALVEHISAQSGSLPSARRLRPYFWNSADE